MTTSRIPRLGILGGGQLARMSSTAAFRLGFRVAILEREPESPAGLLTPDEIIGSPDNTGTLRRFASHADVITLENEFIDSGRLEFLERLGKKVVPSSKSIGLIQDKLIQKEALRRGGIPVPPFEEVRHAGDFDRVAATLGTPVVLKSRKMGYDGYGNAIARSRGAFRKEFLNLTRRHSHLLAEAFVPFQMELAVMVARTRKEIRTYPVVETVQKNHICHLVMAPARIPRRVMGEAAEIAIESVLAIGGYGLFGIEMFLTERDTILVNEMAPRPHNSGHYTIEGCVTSQFENHVRAVMGLPLGSTQMVKRAAVMVNLLGKGGMNRTCAQLDPALRHENAHLHIYGKRVSRPGRKMGHVTLLGDDIPELLKEAAIIESHIRL